MHGSMQNECWHGNNFGFRYRSKHMAHVSSCSNCSIPSRSPADGYYSRGRVRIRMVRSPKLTYVKTKRNASMTFGQSLAGHETPTGRCPFAALTPRPTLLRAFSLFSRPLLPRRRRRLTVYRVKCSSAGPYPRTFTFVR